MRSGGARSRLRAVEFPLEGTRPRRALLALAGVILAAVSYQSVKDWVADYGIRSGELRWTERATSLEPGNGEAWDHLGRLKQWDFSDPDPAQAIAAYSRAVHDDPNSAHYWMDLASAYEAAGDLAQAQAALDRARIVYPLSAEVAWNYGNFLLRQQKIPEGYSEIRRALRSDESLLGLAISRTWRSNGDVSQLLDQVLPADLAAYFQAIDYFASIHEPTPELQVWQRLLQLGKPFDLKRAFPFIDSLIAEDRSEDARRAWGEALVATGMSHDDPIGGSLVWNGDFAHEFLNGGLDWRWNPPIGVAMEFETAPPARGLRALRLDFAGGSNLELNEPFQFVPVEPNRAYRFHASMRTESLTTESGVRFILYDPNHAGVPRTQTENITGTTLWSGQQAEFTTGPTTHFLCVRLYRSPSRMFDNRLSGAAWIADVTLKPLATEAGKTSP